MVVDSTRHGDDGALSAVVGFRLRSTDDVSTTTTTTTVIKLYWRRNTCNAQPGFQYCDLPNSHNSRTYYALYNQARSH